jgi:hypothetical protein
MKMQGHTFDSPNVEICAIPRGNGKPDVIFLAKAVLSYEEFDAICPRPKPPLQRMPGNKLVENAQDPTYLSEVDKYGEYRLAWLILKSLEGTEGLEWDTIDMKNPKTWMNYQDELKAAFFSNMEINRIQQAVFDANAVNEARVNEARENFVRGQAEAQATSSGPSIEQPST